MILRRHFIAMVKMPDGNYCKCDFHDPDSVSEVYIDYYPYMRLFLFWYQAALQTRQLTDQLDHPPKVTIMFEGNHMHQKIEPYSSLN